MVPWRPDRIEPRRAFREPGVAGTETVVAVPVDGAGRRRHDLLLSANRATIDMGIVAYAGQLATIVVTTIVASSARAGIPAVRW